MSDAKRILEPDGVALFLARFSKYGDGLVRSVRLTYASPGPRPRLEVVLSVMYGEAGWGWVNLRLVLEEVDAFVYRQESRASHHVLFEVGGAYFGGLFYLDFDGATNLHDSPEGFRASDFYAAAESVRWSVEPYSERTGETGA